MDEKDPWVLLSRNDEWDDAMVEQGVGPRAGERRARKTNYILLGAAVLAGLVFCVFGGGLNGGAAALTAVLCLGSPLSSTLIAGFASLRLQQTAAASGAVLPGWAAIEELGGVDTVQADADELFTPDSAMLEDIRIFKGGRIARAILYSASVLSKCCNTLSGLFRQIIEDRTDILYPVKDLEVHRGLGFSAWCDNNRILIGTRAYMEKEEVPLPDEEYEAKHSKNGELQILYLAVSGSLHAMFVLHYVGGRNAARGLEVLQRDYQVNVAGPSTMAALLNSLQMGFKTLAIQKRSGEVWQLLGAVKTEFDKFGQGLAKMQQRLRQTDEELDQLIGVRSRAISRKLRGVQSLDEASAATLLELDTEPGRPVTARLPGDHEEDAR